jgi:hypothetical protein
LSMSRSLGIGPRSRIIDRRMFLIGEPVPTPDQVRGKLSPEHALNRAHGTIAAARNPINARACRAFRPPL